VSRRRGRRGKRVGCSARSGRRSYNTSSLQDPQRAGSRPIARNRAQRPARASFNNRDAPGSSCVRTIPRLAVSDVGDSTAPRPRNCERPKCRPYQFSRVIVVSFASGRVRRSTSSRRLEAAAANEGSGRRWRGRRPSHRFSQPPPGTNGSPSRCRRGAVRHFAGGALRRNQPVYGSFRVADSRRWSLHATRSRDRFCPGRSRRHRHHERNRWSTLA
jgi:hypothetical protein